MNKNIVNLFVILFCFFGVKTIHSNEISPFFLMREDGSVLEGYFSRPENLTSPIVFAIQGSSSESAFQWCLDLSEQTNLLGLGLIVLEKQGISKDRINVSEYHATNCLQKRLEDYIFCLKNLHIMNPGWAGKLIFLGESEGGILAANLANQTAETAAVLLFATGGGMKPREEVKWAIQRRLQEHEATQDEIDRYMASVDETMDAMVLNPTSDQSYLGNTYKWWASLLTENEIALTLNKHSCPIYFVHGVNDNTIPIQSADIAAGILQTNNYFSYLRLEKFGHNLDHPNIKAAAFQWLQSALLGQKQKNSNPIPSLNIPSNPSSKEDWKTDIMKYMVSRGRGEVSVGVEGNRDTDGNSRASANVSISKETDGGVKIEGSAEGAIQQDKDGNVTKEAKVEGSASWRF